MDLMAHEQRFGMSAVQQHYEYKEFNCILHKNSLLPKRRPITTVQGLELLRHNDYASTYGLKHMDQRTWDYQPLARVFS